MSLMEKILDSLKTHESITSVDLKVSAQEIFPVILSLTSKEIVSFTSDEELTYNLTDEGENILKNGSYEFVLYNLITEEGMDLDTLEKHKLGKVNAFKNKWIKKEGDRVYRNIDNITDTIRNMCQDIKNKIFNKDSIDILKKRKLIAQSKNVIYTIFKGPNFGINTDYITDLTAKMIISGEYKNMNFKPYNFNTKGIVPSQGGLHPLMKVREEIRKIFLEMGFFEMETNRFVESSFWNFDSLFQPQNHPSRDLQDTFFMKAPSKTQEIPKNYLEKIKKIHSLGDFESDGHFADWDIKEAEKNILRSHTTACSAKKMYELAQGEFKPTKMFSIDRVFRNEALDATHLAEFNQVEGLIVAKGLTLGNLMGYLKSFFEKLGITDIKYKPAFNPYTEPSMEVFGYHKGLGKWIEVGNSGMFRPEVLRPMGFDEDVRAIGFGLSLERPTMIKYGITNIRDLVGPKVDIDFIKKSEICYFK
ncbi:phenylalanine-tRNA ligase alpha subunit (FARSA) [Vairimorpha necatrix]|uniref:Probable phenylalanine--tRNA ligase alpha subunit n=1 Tax=Vairimorpha necatrix TaxID=6039 RepID=A0AAX4J8Q8_9MICR